MRFVIIEVERLRELGIDTITNIKSRDGRLVLIHETLIEDKIDSTGLEKYEKGSAELIALLASPEWATVDPANETEGI